ncbi:MAG: hypothetical protein ACI8ZM_000413 [Crocinitomix sp.]|jgi:hypothetical protein
MLGKKLTEKQTTGLVVKGKTTSIKDFYQEVTGLKKE